MADMEAINHSLYCIFLGLRSDIRFQEGKQKT